MKLLDLVSVVSEYTNIDVRHFDLQIARYDGCDSIPERFNSREVVKVWAIDDELFISIK